MIHQEKGGKHNNEHSETQKHMRKESETLRWSAAGRHRRPTPLTTTPHTQTHAHTALGLDTRDARQGKGKREKDRKREEESGLPQWVMAA